MRTILLVLVILAIAAPAFAQTAAVPIAGKYSEVYVIAGRAIDSKGMPLSGANVVIELDQRGVEAPPLRAAANCKGDFITSFNLLHVDPKGKARVTLLNDDDTRGASTTVALDPFYRRSDAVLRHPGEWQSECKNEVNVWAVSASVSVRLLNRTDPYKIGAHEFHAVPYTGIVRMRYETPDGNTICPPHPQSTEICELFTADVRGDMRYTFTLDQEFEAGGTVDLILQDNSTVQIPVDPKTRLGVKYFELTGRGVPPELYETPGVGVLAPLALFALLAILRRR